MKLKPCPFCGGRAAMHTVPDDDDLPNAGGQFIECASCLASSCMMFPHMEPVDALLSEKWNRRTEPIAKGGAA